MLSRLLVVVIAIGSAAPASAQTAAVPSFEVLAGVNAVLHVADMVGTGYTLTRPAPAFHAREASPYLRPLEGRPVVLAAASGALCVAESVVDICGRSLPCSGGPAVRRSPGR